MQELLAAKRDLDLPRRLRRLDNFDFLLLDDLGYLPQGTEESEVLFTLIAERYERRSLGMTSNLAFSEWERIFANPMATAAAIDRVVHHSVILEFDVPSQLPYRHSPTERAGQGGEPANLVDARSAEMLDAGTEGVGLRAASLVACFSAIGSRPSETAARLSAPSKRAWARLTVGYGPRPMSHRLPLTTIRWTQDLVPAGAT